MDVPYLSVYLILASYLHFIFLKFPEDQIKFGWETEEGFWFSYVADKGDCFSVNCKPAKELAKVFYMEEEDRSFAHAINDKLL